MKIALIPLDDRPVTRALPVMAAAVAGVQVITPPRDLLGTLNWPGDPAAIAGWLRALDTPIDGVVVAVEMLGHGGLVPSRRGTEDAAQVVARIEALRDVRARYRDIPIYGFTILQRISNSASNQEEKPYWDRFGRAMFRLSQLTDAVGRYGRAEDHAELERLRAEIPAEIVEDYQRTRRRNLQVNLTMIDWAAEGIFDYLAITQDDANPLGFPAMEQRRLAAHIADRRAYACVGVYPGADEVATTLLARMVCARAGLRPRVYARYSSTRGPLIVANYEDRPLGETVKGHVRAAGGLMAETPTEADLILMVNTPAEAQAEALDGIDYTTVETPGRNLDEFVAALRDYQDRRIPTALADVAYSNGADPALMPRLFSQAQPLELLAYAGWNTAGNTIGSALGHAYLRLLALRRDPGRAEERAHVTLLLTRYLDDWAYQAVIRSTAGVQRLERECDVSYDDLGDRAERVSTAVTGELRAFYDKWLRPHLKQVPDPLATSSVRIGPVGFPWNRLFEVEAPIELSSDA